MGLPGSCQQELQAKGVHLWPFVDIVLSRVAQAILKSPSFLCEGPDEAFSGGESLRLASENGVFKGHGGIDPLPSRGFERTHDIGKHKVVQGIEVHQQSVANVAAQNIESQPAIARREIRRER